MTNRRLTISALALILMTGCGEERGLNPELLNLVGTWEAATFVVTQVAAPMTVVDVLSPAPAGGDVTAADFFFYDDGTFLQILSFPDTADAVSGAALSVREYEVTDFEVFGTGDLLSTQIFRLRGDGDALDFTAEADLIANVEAACGSTVGTNATGGPTSPCLVIVFELGETDEEVLTFTRSGDDMTFTGTVEFDFGAGDEDATLSLNMDRIIPTNPPQDLNVPIPPSS